MWRWLGVACLAFGCGRVGFDELDAARAVQPALVNTATVETKTGTVVTVPDVRAGSASMLVAVVIAYQTAAITSIADDFGNTYADSGATSVSPTVRTSIWYAANSTAGSGTLAVQLAAPFGASVWFGEFSGLAALDGIGSNGAGMIAPTIDSPVAAVRGDNELVISVLEMTAGAIDGVASPFIEWPELDGDEAAYAFVSGPAPAGAVWTAEGSGNTCSSTATFAPL